MNEKSPNPLSDEAKALLRSARPPRARSAEERKRTAANIARIARAPIAASVGWVWWMKSVALAATVSISAAVIAAKTTQRPQAPTSSVATPSTPSVRRAAPPSVAPAPNVRVLPQETPAIVPTPPAPVPPAPTHDRPLVRRTHSAGTTETRPTVLPPVQITAVTPVETPTPVVAPVVAAPAPTTAEATPSTEAGGAEANDAGAPSIEEDVHMLQTAQRMLQSQPATALELLTQHARRFPNSVLSDEREFFAIDALQRLGRNEEATNRARALLSHAPNSTVVRRVQRVLDRMNATP